MATEPVAGSPPPGAAWRFAATAGGSTAVSALASLLALSATAVILRTLPVGDAGRFALFFSLLQLVAVVGAAGQPPLMMRLYSHKTRGHFDWVRDLRGGLKFSLPLLALAVGACAIGYGLSPGLWIVLGAGAALLTATQSAALILNSQRHYTWSALLLRLPMGLMIVPALVVLIFPGAARLDFMLAALLASTGVSVAVALERLHTKVPRGVAAIAPESRWQGFGFAALAITHLLPDQGLVAIAGAVARPEELAAYAALAVLVRPIVLVRSVFQPLLTVEAIREPRLHRGHLTVGMWIGTLLLTGVAVLAGPFAASLVYGGRYDGFSSLIAPLALAAGLLLVEALPRSDVVGRAPPGRLNRYVWSQVVIAGLGAAAAVVAVVTHGVAGVAWVAVGVGAARVLGAYAYRTRFDLPSPFSRST